MTQSLLDNEKNKLINTKEEDIIWKGNPKVPFVISYLSNGGYHDVRSGGASPFVLLVMGTITMAFIFQQIIGDVGIIIAIVLGTIVFIRPNIILSKRKKETVYYILKDGIYFKFWGWKDEKSTFIPFKDIKKISLIPFNTGEGYIILYLKEPTKLKTYDFVRNKPFNHPTFVMIKEVKKVAQLINDHLKTTAE